ncbi:MAG: hypothetical protein HC942_29620 [Microcoleus sp. SU_5_6]|nr:hypothetical protein [Microcoleus sp. SU_5_6]
MKADSGQLLIQISTVCYQLSTKRAGTGAPPLQLSTVNCQLSTINCLSCPKPLTEFASPWELAPKQLN